MECWSYGEVDYWSTGLLEYWSNGLWMKGSDHSIWEIMQIDIELQSHGTEKYRSSPYYEYVSSLRFPLLARILTNIFQQLFF